MSLRPFLLTLGAVVVVALGACTLNTAGLGSTTSSTSAAGAGGDPSSLAVVGSGQGSTTGATAQVGAGGAEGTGTSSASSSAATSSASSSVTSSVSSAVSSSASSAVSSGVSGSSSSGGVVTCTGQYGGIHSYELCKEDAQSCEFYAEYESINDKPSCTELCTKHGGQCQGTFDNGLTTCAHAMNGNTCDTKFFDAICICSLGCGGGPPCPPLGTCNNGTCIFLNEPFWLLATLHSPLDTTRAR